MALGYYDDDGLYHYGEDDLAAPAGRFSGLLNRLVDSIPTSVAAMVGRALAADPGLGAALTAALLAKVTALDVPAGKSRRIPQRTRSSKFIRVFLDRFGRKYGHVAADGTVVFARLLIPEKAVGVDQLDSSVGRTTVRSTRFRYVDLDGRGRVLSRRRANGSTVFASLELPPDALTQAARAYAAGTKSSLATIFAAGDSLTEGRA